MVVGWILPPSSLCEKEKDEENRLPEKAAFVDAN